MGFQVVDAVAVVHSVVGLQLVDGAEAVLDDEDGQLVPLVEGVQAVAQTHRVDLPAPLRRFDVGVGHGVGVAAAETRVFHLHVRPHAVGHVVADADVVHRAARQNLLIAGQHLGGGALPRPLLAGVGGIVAAAVHIAEIIALVHGFLGHDHIVRVAGVGVERHECAHAANFKAGIDGMAFGHHQSRGHQLVVHGLIQRLFGISKGGVAHAGVGPAEDVVGGVGLVVDLVEGHPVLDLALVALHHGGGVMDKEVHQLAVDPAAVLFRQGVGHLEVGEGDDRLDAVFEQFVKQVIVELQARFVRLLLVPAGKNAAPGNGSAEALEAQLSEQFHVLFVGVVKVDAGMVGVVFAGQDAIGDAAGRADAAAGHHVADAGAAAVGVPGTFQLVGSDRTAPKKVFRKHS